MTVQSTKSNLLSGSGEIEAVTLHEICFKIQTADQKIPYFNAGKEFGEIISDPERASYVIEALIATGALRVVDQKIEEIQDFWDNSHGETVVGVIENDQSIDHFDFVEVASQLNDSYDTFAEHIIESRQVSLAGEIQRTQANHSILSSVLREEDRAVEDGGRVIMLVQGVQDNLKDLRKNYPDAYEEFRNLSFFTECHEIFSAEGLRDYQEYIAEIILAASKTRYSVRRLEERIKCLQEISKTSSFYVNSQHPFIGCC